MGTIYESTYWSVTLPPNWTGNQEENLSTFTSTPEIGALQISWTLKENGLVTDEDILEFADDSIKDGITTYSVSIAGFSGLYITYEEDKVFWREWWLRHKNLMLYVTYNSDANLKDSETEIIDGILSSLQPKQLTH